MTNLSCPECGATGRALRPNAWVESFYCDACHTVWFFDQRDPQPSPVLIATPKQDRRRLQSSGDRSRHDRSVAQAAPRT